MAEPARQANLEDVAREWEDLHLAGGEPPALGKQKPTSGKWQMGRVWPADVSSLGLAGQQVALDSAKALARNWSNKWRRNRPVVEII